MPPLKKPLVLGNKGVSMSQVEHSGSKRILLMIFAAVALVILLMYMQGSFESKVDPGVTKQDKPLKLPPNSTVLVEKKQVDDVMAWPGTVKSKTVANISAKMTARILEIKVHAGDKVKKGDVIARLDERDVRDQEQTALAALAGANALASKAKADEQRIRSLYGKEAATRENLDGVVSQAKQAQAGVNQASSVVNEVRAHLADTILLAPFDGSVLKRLKEPGDMALPGSPLVSVQTEQGLRLEADVPTSCAGQFYSGMSVTVRIDALSKTVNAQIDEISPEVDPQTRTQLIKISLPALTGLQPGFFGWMEQACNQHDALIIPASAVQHIGQLEMVQVLIDGQAQTRHIRTAKKFGEQIEVVSGLHAGETVILQPAQVQ
jgi:RND family efflux transporter MFP subunit